jgi:nucleotide-binding universal stress UspA family protein
MLYHLATGARPFGAPTSVRGLRRRLYHEPVPPRLLRAEMPPWLQEVILHCLEVQPARRHQSAAQLAFELQNPDQVTLTERAERITRAALLTRWKRWFKAIGAEPTFTGGATDQAARSPILLAALDIAGAEPALLDAVRLTVQRMLQTEPGARLACLAVLKTNLIGSDELVEEDGSSRHLSMLVQLKHWAHPIVKAIDPHGNGHAGRVTFHVLEAPDAASAIVDYASKNQVDAIVLGARSSGGLRRYLGSVSAQVAAEAPCTVTVVRT